MTANLASFAYLASGVLFILALRGLSNPETSRQGNLYGMLGMAIAVGVTLATVKLDQLTLGLIAGAVLIGGGLGAFIANRSKLAAMPQLVAAFHALVGLAAICVAAAVIYAPDSFHVAGAGGTGVKAFSLVTLSLGAAIGAITFTGSAIAFAKLNGNMSGAPILLPGRHFITIVIAFAIAAIIYLLIQTGGASREFFWILTALALVIGILLIIPIAAADMPVVVSMLNSCSGWAAAALGFTLESNALIVAGALVGSSGAALSYIMCKEMNRSLISVILGGSVEGAGPAAVAETPAARPGGADDAPSS